MKNLNRLILCLLFILITANSGVGQIAITEVYYDTPYLERTNLSDISHAGEYIELFNYTTIDIDISGWRIFSYSFPDGTIIKSGDFIILAWDRREFDNQFLTNFFPNLQDKESKIFYHNDFLLNNYKSNVTLYMTSLLGIKLPKREVVQSILWDFPRKIEYEHNYVDPDTYNGVGYNYDYNYYKKSLQLNSQSQFLTERVEYGTPDFNLTPFREATPMSLDYPVELIPIENVPRVMDVFFNNYDHFIGNSGVLELLNNTCEKNILLIFENIINDSVLSEKCPEYDEAGNFIGMFDNCPFGKQNQKENDISETDLVNDYASKIWLAPNPTRSKTTIYWEKEINDLIAEIVVISLNGGQHIPINYIKGNEYAEINLTTHPSGIYVVRFKFLSGQIVTKSIIKS